MKSSSLRSLFLTTAVLSLAAQSTHADQLVSDTFVVKGPVSLGLDAQTGWGYGFDTLVMRENNLRIFFDDTTTSGTGYGSNDWRIAINDTGTGGLNYFAIEDATASRTPFRIMAGARNNALYINSNGKVGLNSTNAQLDLHIASSDTPAIRMEQTAGQYTAQTWDIGANEANFFVRDLTGGSRLPFRIRPGAPTSTLDLRANGSVGIGLADQNAVPRARVHMNVNAAGNEGVLIGPLAIPTNSATLHVEGTGYITQKLGIGANSTNQSATLHVNGTVFVAQTLEIGSSRTRKENVRELTLEEAKATLQELNPVGFNYIGDSEDQLGFIAEDVPNAVATESRKSLVPMDFVAVLTKVVQHHEQRESELRQTIASQGELLQKLAARLAAMEQTLQQNNLAESR